MKNINEMMRNVILFLSIVMELKILRITKIYIYIEIGDIIINKHNKLQFNYGSPKGFSKEYNIPVKHTQYLDRNVWNIKNIF